MSTKSCGADTNQGPVFSLPPSRVSYPRLTIGLSMYEGLYLENSLYGVPVNILRLSSIKLRERMLSKTVSSRNVLVALVVLVALALVENGLIAIASHRTYPTDLGIWSDTYSSRNIVDTTLKGGKEFVMEVNVTNVPETVSGTDTAFNGFDITIEYDAALVKVNSASRLVFDASGEDTIVSVAPVRVPALAEGTGPLRSFQSSPRVKFIDLDSDGLYLIGETLVLDINNDNLVDSGDRVVSVTPDRAPLSSELGKPLLVQSSIRFYDADSDLSYDLGELLVFDLDDGLSISKPLVETGVAAPTCHFYEGCLFDNTRGTPLQGRIVNIFVKSCDAGCPSTTPGKARLAVELLGVPTIAVPAAGLSGTLFRMQFKTQGTTGSPVLGDTIIKIANSTLTCVPINPSLCSPIPHDKIDGSFANIVCPGDVNDDEVVNVDDLAVVGAAFGSNVGDPRYNIDADLNQDGFVNVDDLAVVGANFGRTCS